MDVEELIGLEPETPETEHTIYELFKWSLLIKGTISFAECIVGLGALLVPPSTIVRLVDFLGSLVPPGSHNVIITHLISELDMFTVASVLFVSLYLLTRGVVKLFLVIQLLRNRFWAYPASLVVLGLFVLFQFYQIIAEGSIVVVAITVFDLIVMYLIWREYRIVRIHRAKKA